ncbi:alpha/beta hydrolase [Jeotgalibacillus terrae]|uniref:Alpha/beta hydrolase n=1 Tax=Jeotgalibacillus terrae TaxID=587735 RepID=A0ABW5ZE28_9BACL|nr:alpha/beta hydrolase-fold protein [Jeotgalibacillus terrae]MBM7579082.1 putative alpha/beta superfamily hydrolase [Jeotgalibacillus terrae]
MKADKWQNIYDTPEEHTISGDVRILKDMDVPQLNTTKNISIYLPPGYEEGDKRYPVLYMHDGQNVFDEATSNGQEWGVDESLEKLASQSDSYEAIVVAIDHGETERNNEYNVHINLEHHFGGKGKDYLAFLTETLKPWIDKEFKTRPEPEHTAIGGSSFGAYISLYAGVAHPDVFGKVMAFSLMVWQDENTLKDLIGETDLSALAKVYLNIGDKEDKSPSGAELLVNDVKKIHEALLSNGFPEERLRFDVIEGGKHRESTWRETFPEAFKWLIP